MYDLVVIGGGPGGYAAAIRAAQLDARVALVEMDMLGGTCVNRGCIPVKVWLGAADTLRRIQGADLFGIQARVEKISFDTVVERKNGVAKDIGMGMKSLLASYGVEVIQGQARFINPGEIQVDTTVYAARNFIIATGSRLDVPDIPGLAAALLTTDQVFDLEKMPASVLIHGAGPVEVELATIFSRFSTQVFLSFETRQILPDQDPDSSQRLARSLRDQGITLLNACKLRRVDPCKEKFSCVFDREHKEDILVERVVWAARAPNTRDLGLDAANVALGPDQAVLVDETLKTGSSRIYAVGDAVGRSMQSHAASAMAVTAAQNALGRKDPFPFHLVPKGVWSFPEVASVGLTEEGAEARDYDVEVGEFPYAVNGLSMAVNETAGAVKVVTEEHYGKILGVHIVGPHANELIGEAVTAMQFEYTVAELAAGIRVHPTFSENVVDAARDAQGWALYLPRR